MISLILHIGTHKTGTTVFQRTIWENRKALNIIDNIVVINIFEFIKRKDLEFTKTYNNQIVEDLKSFLEKKIKNKSKRYIISWEGFSGDPFNLYNNVEVVSKIIKDATINYNTSIVLCLRRQDDFIQSIYMQAKHENVNGIKINELLSKIDLLDWNRFIERFIYYFGSNKVQVLPYDRVIFDKKSIIQLLGIEIGSNFLKVFKKVPIKNVGFSKNALEIFDNLSKKINIEQRKVLRDLLQEVSNKGAFREYNIIDENTKLKIVEQFKMSNSVISKKYWYEKFGMENFSTPEFQPSEQLPKIDDIYLNIILSALSKIEISNNLARESTYHRFVKKLKNRFRNTFL